MPGLEGGLAGSLGGALARSLAGIAISGPLAANAGPDATLVYGTATALAGSASGGVAPYTYAWSVVSSPNDALCSFSNAASATSNATLTGPNGTFTVRLTVTDSAGATAIDDVVLTLNATTLAEILGANVLLNYDATALSNGAVASWPSTGSNTTALAPESTSPVRAATSFNSAYPGVTFNTQTMLATLSGSGIPSGSRPYMFCVAQMVSLPAGANYGTIAKINVVTTASSWLDVRAHGSGVWKWRHISGASSDDGIATSPTDLLPHVFGVGFTADPLCFALDGAMRAGTHTAVTDANITKVRLGSQGSDLEPANVVVAQFIVCASMPSTEQIAAVNAYLRNKWGISTTIMSSTEAFYLTQLDAAFATGGFGGIETVGTNVFMLPWGGVHTKMAKWDSTKPFRNTASWTVTDLGPSGLGAAAGASGCNDGRYIYISPFNFNFIRYDTVTGAVASFDLRSLNGGVAPPSTSGGCCYDGSRYVYIVPGFAADLRGHIVVRYDTLAGNFTSSGSYEKFDTTLVNAACCGYLGNGFDGRWVYFSPYAKNGVVHGQFLRFDTQATIASFATSTSAWETFDLTTKNAALVGMNGIVCVGTKVYLVPGEVTYNAGDGSVGVMYDSTGSFTSPASYTTFDFHTVGSTVQGLMFAFYDNSRYIYYPQEHTVGNAHVTRFDTQGAGYANPSSYKIVDARQLGLGFPGYLGGAAVGQHRLIAPAYGPYALKTYGSPAS